MNINNRKFKIAIVIIVIQALIIIGVLVVTRVLYPQSFGSIDEVPWDNLPTMTKRVLQDTPTKTIEPIRVLFNLENCTYPSSLILDQLSNAKGVEADVWIGRQKYTKSEAFSILEGDLGKIYQDLFFQVYTTKINILLGANASLIGIELDEAETWISAYDPEVIQVIDDLRAAVKLTNTLYAFNNGLIGPGLCEETTASLSVSLTPDRLSLATYTLTPVFQKTPTSTRTPTPTPSSAYTSTPTPTSSPTRTPTPTISNTPYAGVVRTSTPIPTKTEKPDDPDPTKEEPAPTARNTRVPPTDPPPTDPPPTDKPTDEPTPTLANP